jgi:hypothetical protein
VPQVVGRAFNGAHHASKSPAARPLRDPDLNWAWQFVWVGAGAGVVPPGRSWGLRLVVSPTRLLGHPARCRGEALLAQTRMTARIQATRGLSGSVDLAAPIGYAVLAQSIQDWGWGWWSST